MENRCQKQRDLLQESGRLLVEGFALCTFEKQRTNRLAANERYCQHRRLFGFTHQLRVCAHGKAGIGVRVGEHRFLAARFPHRVLHCYRNIGVKNLS